MNIFKRKQKKADQTQTERLLDVLKVVEEKGRVGAEAFSWYPEMRAVIQIALDDIERREEIRDKIRQEIWGHKSASPWVPRGIM